MLYTKQIQTFVTNDCSEDFVLPDYYPEIRRIIGVRCTAAAEGKYVSGDEIEADGCVVYTVLYTDGDGEICQVSETTQYTASLPVKGDGLSPDGIVLDTAADGVVCRVTAPRKITLSAKVKTSARSTAVSDVAGAVGAAPSAGAGEGMSSALVPAGSGDGGNMSGKSGVGVNQAGKSGVGADKTGLAGKAGALDGSGVARKSGFAEMSGGPIVRRKVKSVTSAELAELRANSTVEGELREREGMGLVSAFAEICVSDVRISGSSVSVKGDAYATLLLKNVGEGEKYSTAKSRVPVDLAIPIPERYLKGQEGAKVSLSAFADVHLVEAEISDDGLVSWRAEYSVDVDMMRSCAADLTEDAYIPSAESEEVETAQLSMYECAASSTGRLTVQVSGKLKSIKPGAGILFAWGEGFVDKAALSGGRMTLTGKVKITGIADCGGEIVSEEFVSPVKYEAECESSVSPEDKVGGRMRIRVCDIVSRVDGDEAVFSAELAVSVFIMKEKSEEAVVSITPAGDVPEARAVITVYAADEGESAWDVEKKFRLGYPAVSNAGVYVI